LTEPFSCRSFASGDSANLVRNRLNANYADPDAPLIYDSFIAKSPKLPELRTTHVAAQFKSMKMFKGMINFCKNMPSSLRSTIAINYDHFLAISRTNL